MYGPPGFLCLYEVYCFLTLRPPMVEGIDVFWDGAESTDEERG
jgi:hypothetical protein